ncbi:ARL14 effector protein-like [Schistocerca nitens]|uniref:ARL14 effector protein-like n=1 Tax=Schistocerca nitens TaxID=7011 RepID=UPI002117F7FB|nr:ARL14 effector protein-like [Schistocerca nitens]
MDAEGNSIPSCSIGQGDSGKKCHVTFFAKKAALKWFADFSDEEKELLVRRSEAKLDNTSQVCLHHEALLLTQYERLQKKCFNPFGKVNHNVKAGILDTETANKASDMLKKQLVNNIKPGQKICPACRTLGRSFISLIITL